MTLDRSTSNLEALLLAIPGVLSIAVFVPTLLLDRPITGWVFPWAFLGIAAGVDGLPAIWRSILAARVRLLLLACHLLGPCLTIIAFTRWLSNYDD